jgi:ABC-type transport system involved in multi-copper enzyme maturation permease subunit
MTILPILKRELVSAARRGGEQGIRSFFAATMLTIILITFTTWYYWEAEQVTDRLMALVAERSFFIVIALHSIVLISVMGQTVRCIAVEKDRRTFDFLLVTRLGNTEIIIGKLAAHLLVFLATLSAGLPIMLLLNQLGGVDGRLILMAYAGIVSTGFFLAALSIWFSTIAPDNRSALALAFLCSVAWFSGPFFATFLLPRLGVRLPDWLRAVNSWLLASSPASLLMKLPSLVAGKELIESLAWMCGLQAVGAAICLIGSIVQLRSAYRAAASGEARVALQQLMHTSWRLRPRPPVGDDPIFWRERYTNRSRGLARLFDLLVYLGIGAAIAYPTWLFGKPALVEVWNHGYASGLTSDERPEFNLFVRFFANSGTGLAADQSRIDFNVFLRFITVFFSFFVGATAAGLGVEGIAAERSRETWSSLIATPLTARDILWAKSLATFWRLRLGVGTIVVLWTLGLIAGAIHPLGFVLSLLLLFSWTWFMVACGIICAIQSRIAELATPPIIGFAYLLIGTAALPIFLPAGMSSVLLGSGSSPFVLWLAEFSYRDLRNALHYPVYPHLQWIGIRSGEGPLWVAATCLIGIVAPMLWGVFVWRYAIAHFDRHVGRPWRENPVEAIVLAAEPAQPGLAFFREDRFT